MGNREGKDVCSPSVGDRVSGGDIALLLTDTERPLRIGIDGPGGSGKSTLAQNLVAALPAGATLVNGDDFYRPSTDPRRSDERIGGLIDIPRMGRQVLDPHREGKQICYQRYDWHHDQMGEWVNADANITLIVEGVYSTHRALRAAYDVLIWVNADRLVRLTRGLARDGERARSMWESVWIPAEDRYLVAQAPADAAHLVLDGGDATSHRQALFAVIGGSCATT